MRAFIVTGPGHGEVREVPAPRPQPGEVVVEVARVGVCGTDVEFFTGEMAYLHQGHAQYPLRLGHEWSGTVSAIGAGVAESWLGGRVTADTMLGCGRCRRCRSGRHNVCQDRFEIGIRGGFPGALAEQLAVPVSAILALPDAVDDAAGALVEPGGNALRAVRAAQLTGGDRVLVIGLGTIDLLAALFARQEGAEVHVVDRSARALEFARSMGFVGVSSCAELPAVPWDAVIDASNDSTVPALALELVEPGRRIVYIGLAGTPSILDTRTLVLKDVTAVGILAASAGLVETIDRYAAGLVDPRPLVAAVVGLDGVAAVLAGNRPVGSGPGPKVHIDPRPTFGRADG
jgi:threonine dehydrogenase-like Zn-dependent dehydrogenase